ncbi:FG-GAP-like repeat-containing protein [Agromyces sp. ISL-38]|uniref:FG-GAP-like repeat-containing protein n=1 Tax=Agromyces sp. ISL-38 TaxID=2819107 RepID=UPI001BEC5493|nr:FG-GAP-like repeat-containing protein [Agromyces sp. ISL-38]MBT2516502.1 VCBS repeat-containing protein [Streptomyces sp. ISL-90]
MLPGQSEQAKAISDNPQVLAQALMNARAQGRFDSISYGVVSQIIAPVARGEVPIAGCRLDTRVFQILVLTLNQYGSLYISDLLRSCPGVLQNPPCPTSYISPHCSDPGRAVDFVRVGGIRVTGGAESIPFLRFLDSIVPRGTQAGQSACGSSVYLEYITSRFADSCDHLHLAIPTSGTVRDGTIPASDLARLAIGTADFSGDGSADVFRIVTTGTLSYYQGDGQGSWLSPAGIPIGSSWDAMEKVVAPGDFTGDGKSDVIGITTDGTMRLYPGDGAGGWADAGGTVIGTGWNMFTMVFSPGDFTGDGRVDIIGVRPDGTMSLYSGNGSGGWGSPTGQVIGSGWGQFTKVLSPGDFTGDAKPDVLAVTPAGSLRMYTGNGSGGWADPSGIVIGTEWDQFITVTSPGDFTGDGAADILGVTESGVLRLYRGNGAGGWGTHAGEQIGTGWR